MFQCEGDQLITGKWQECLWRPRWIFHKRVSKSGQHRGSSCFAVILLWWVQQSLPILLDSSFSVSRLLLSYTSELGELIRLSWTGWSCQESCQENSKQFWSQSLLYIPPDQWEEGEVSRWHHLFWSKLSSNTVRMTVHCEARISANEQDVSSG